MEALGKNMWIVPGGHIPAKSNGHEPEMVSNDKMSVLNVSQEEADLNITIYYGDDAPLGPYNLKVEARRVRKVRFNDLIDPRAIPLGKDYSAVISSNVPVVIQFSRLDSSHSHKAITGTMAYSESS
ncbi:sensory rhodopsin transducer [Cytophagaceae bacterium ABcell3]|nr:sensory rhodopsin transducer [Cytophagaceae bacterium ABcell3]